MTDDLARSLREEGYEDVAQALERKQLADQLREAGRDDLAGQVEQPAADSPNHPVPQNGESPAEVGALAATFKRDLGVDLGDWNGGFGPDAA